MKRIVSFLMALLFVSSFALSLLPALPAKADVTYEQSLRNAGFPESYVTKLSLLHDLHPTWQFKPVLITNMKSAYTWDYVINQETSPQRNLIYHTYPWQDYASSETLLESGLWRQATKETIEFFMDPRNFLDERNIFMFETLRSSGAVYTLSDIQSALNGTFMANATLENGKTYAQNFYDIGAATGVSALHLATRVKQEQGTGGTSPLISGTCGNTLWSYYQNGTNGAPSSGYTESGLKAYNGYYNYFNIGASGTGYFNIYLAGMQEAQQGGWRTRHAAIQGGAQKIYDKYISDYQHTLYFQKFNVHPSSGRNFWGQYMQNVSAAYSEGRSIQKTYADNGLLNSAFTFEIPVYSGMPETCPDPGSSFEATTLSGMTKNVTSTSGFSYDTGIINKLTADISGGITLNGRSLIVDLNGHTWSNSGSVITLDTGSIGVYDSVGGGAITSSGSDAVSMGNGTASFRNIKITANANGMDAIYCDGGHLNVTNCVLSAPKAGINVSNGSEASDPNARSVVSVSGGEFANYSGTLDTQGRNCAIEIRNNADEISLSGKIVFTNNKIISKTSNSKAIKDAITILNGEASFTAGGNFADYKTATISYTGSSAGNATINNVSNVNSFNYGENIVNKLTADVSGSVHIKEQNLVVDLAGHKWTNANNAVILETGSVHIYDSVGGGSIVTTTGDAISMGNGTALFEDITITGGGDGMDAIFCNGGNLTVNNCILSAPKAGINVCNESEAADANARSVVSVNGGTFAKYSGTADSQGRNCAIEIRNNADEITLSGNIKFLNNVIISKSSNSKPIKNAITIGAGASATYTSQTGIADYAKATISYTGPNSDADEIVEIDISKLPTAGTFTGAGFANDQYFLNIQSGGQNNANGHSIGVVDLSTVKKIIVHYGNDGSAVTIGTLVLKNKAGEDLASVVLNPASSWKQFTSATFDVSDLLNNEELFVEITDVQNGIAISKIELVKTAEKEIDAAPDWECDFESAFYDRVSETGWAFSSGAAEDGNTLRNIWKFLAGASGPTGTIELMSVANADGNYMVIGGINAVACNSTWTSDWSFSTDVNVSSADNAGSVILFNYDYNSTTDKPSYNIFEAAPGYSAANKPARYVGNSGIGVALYTTSENDIVCIYILTADDAGNYSHIEYEIPFDKGTFTNVGWVNIGVTVVGKTAYILLDNEVISYVQYSSIGTSFTEISNSVYRKATIYSADGKAVANTDEALIALRSTIGMASRAGLLNVDNIVLGDADKTEIGKPGDVTGDGAVDARDIVIIRRYVAGGWDISYSMAMADVTNDGVVNARDVVKIRRSVAGGW